MLVPGGCGETAAPRLLGGSPSLGAGERGIARSLAPRLCGKSSKDSRCVNKRIAAALCGAFAAARYYLAACKTLANSSSGHKPIKRPIRPQKSTRTATIHCSCCSASGGSSGTGRRQAHHPCHPVLPMALRALMQKYGPAAATRRPVVTPSRRRIDRRTPREDAPRAGRRLDVPRGRRRAGQREPLP